MRVPARYALGVATHTGLVRKGNEDDYLVLAPPERAPCDLVAAVADGMGGVAGGAEASRAGLRGFAAGLLGRDGRDGAALAAAVGAGFAAASERVLEQARLVPALREMGTTLTALAFAGDRAAFGHVGDTRAYLWRRGELRQLTTDHASREHQNRLFRCIGAGQPAESPDVGELAIGPGDRLLLCTDGVWGTVPAPQLAAVVGRLPPQAAAEQLLRLALQAGAPDNATAVVVHVTGEPVDAERDVELPSEEAPGMAELMRVRGRLGAPWWPLWLTLLAVVLIAFALLRWLFGFDVLVWLRSQ